MKKTACLIFVSLLFTFISCDDDHFGFEYPPDNAHKVTIVEGTWGNVWFWEGDFMPGNITGKITRVVREIYIYQATHNDSVVHDSNNYVFIKQINSTLISQITSDSEGFFQISLPPGKYSLFAKEDSLFFANSMDEDGYLMSAEVRQNEVVKRQIDINYKAAY